MDSPDVAMHYGGFNSIRGCFEPEQNKYAWIKLLNAKVRPICFLHCVYVCIYIHIYVYFLLLFLARCRLSMEPREDLV